MQFTFKFILFFLLIPSLHSSHARIFSFKMHHRFSEQVKKWSGDFSLHDSWPEKRSVEYYAQLAYRDRFFHGRNRKLSESDGPLAFSDGNSSFRISSLGFLHYTTVQLGTPGMKFMVALDTGSDLFWVPCDCSRCAPTEGSPYASDFEFSVYSPKESTSSKIVTCNNSLCTQHDQCIKAFGNCPYVVSYVSAETSTTGILIEDVLHLKTEDKNSELIQAYVTFGCGQVQSGSFLDVAAPNGLFGLGMEEISVPSILSREGLMANSFSMCFGDDGIGRINFGDQGSPDQEETPFNLNQLHPTYNITVTRIQVGTTLIEMDTTVLFDSGTSFTYFTDPIYSKLSESFHSQTRDGRRPPNPRIPFEYCYNMRSYAQPTCIFFNFDPAFISISCLTLYEGSPDANASLTPGISLTMKGGSPFSVYDPIIVISIQNELIYCLAVVKSTDLNIIGQNFMTGYRIVFDREKLVLGWKKFDCYDIEEHNFFPVKPDVTTIPPAVAAGVGNHSSPGSTEETKISAHISTESEFNNLHSLSTCFRIFILLLFLL